MAAKVILCVDDEPTVLTTRKMVLQSVGYRVLTATNGRDGLTMFCEQPVEAVVLDYAMPGMDGGELASEIKRRNPEVPIMMLSAYMYLPDAALQDVDLYLTKTDGPVAMINGLKSLLHEQEMCKGAA
jgi:CheY-like chemotaxis protein